MTNGSILNPASMRAQSNAAISMLREENEHLQTANIALNAFIDDETNQGRSFENLRQKMQDFHAVSNAFSRANDADISDHMRIIATVGDERLVGSVILQQHSNSILQRRHAERMIARYAGVRNSVSLLQRLNPFDQTYNNAYTSQRNWENIRDKHSEIIREMERKIAEFNRIDQATSNLFTAGNELRIAAKRGLEFIQEAATGLPNSYDTEGLRAWRVDIALTKEKIAYELFNALFNELFCKDENGNISEASWKRIEELLARSAEKINDVEFRALWSVFVSLEREEDLARFIVYASVGGFGNFPNNNISRGVERIMALGIGFSAVLSSITDTFLPFIERNHAHNSQFEFSGMIFSQRHEPASLLEMGRHPGSYNGCAWIAVYNALLLLGEQVHPADIIRYYQRSGGALINGEFGINPLAIRNNFKRLGYNVTMLNLPPSVDDLIRASTVSILTYAHPRGAHTVMVYYDDGVFYVFNEPAAKSTPTAPGVQTSFDAWIESMSGYCMISAIGIR